jgi:hypothetical protein
MSGNSARALWAGRMQLGGRVAVAIVCLGLAQAAAAAEISAFVSKGRPGEAWSGGWGGMLTITFFDVVHGEIEGAYQGSSLVDTHLLTASGKAYVGPTLGRLVPYAGLGAGVYHESIAGGSDSGTLGSVFVGLKLKFPVGLVLRAEYQWINMPQAAPLKLDSRYLFAAGLRF